MRELELTSDQLAEMRWTEDSTTGRPIKLDHTTELERDYRVWLAVACQLDDVRLFRCALSNGSEQIRSQCRKCGQPFGQPVKRSTVPDLSELPVGCIERLAEYETERRNQLRELRRRHAALQLRPGWGSSEYQRYLKSSEWKQKRKAVFDRARHMCEGCGIAKAEVVHHHHYDNIYQEWLWDLVALCMLCHRRCHPEHRSGDD